MGVEGEEDFQMEEVEGCQMEEGEEVHSVFL
jgi:hypothetical protein